MDFKNLDTNNEENDYLKMIKPEKNTQHISCYKATGWQGLQQLHRQTWQRKR